MTTRRPLVVWLCSLALSAMLMLTAVPRVRADFPTEFTATDLDKIAKQYDCDKIPLESPTPGVLLIPRGARTNTDGKYHQPYHAACHVYVRDPDVALEAPPGFTQRFLIYGANQESKPDMILVAKLLAILWNEEFSRLHHDHLSDELTLQVWLSEVRGAGLSPDTGGEQFKNQIYIYDVLRDRRPIEWAREVAHEYGHYALPGISGFKSPEEWANGVLGERLYLKWIAEDIKSGKMKETSLPFIASADLNEYIGKQVDPLIRRIDTAGISGIDFARRDAEGMDNYTALALYIDSFYGSGQLLKAMSYTAPARQDVLAEAHDFLAGFLESIRAAQKLSLVFVIEPTAQPQIKHVLYLPAGSYIVGSSKGVQDWQIRQGGKSIIRQAEKSRKLTRTGWYTMVLDLAQPPGEHQRFTLSLNSVH